jgi:hypothetical protein
VAAHRTTVRLTGIALRHQGTHDSFCAYYAAAMLLCAVRPEFDDHFDAAHVAHDPILGNLPRRGALDRAVAQWLTSGVHIEKVCSALNRACAKSGHPNIATRFAYRSYRRASSGASFVRSLVDRGLPCVVGWESREIGNHTVVVVGYERFARSSRQWLRLLDPSRVQDCIEWGQLIELATARLDLLYCVRHDGLRPDKITTTRSSAGAIVAPGSKIERWDPTTRRYRSIVG